MKKILLSLLALAGYVTASAQITDVVSATLITGDKTQVFYGYSSFATAVDSAEQTGSTIVLSPGAFSSPGTVQKSVKVYGAGFQPDTLTGLSETRVLGKLTIKSSDEFTPNDVHLEGIYFTDPMYLAGTPIISGTEVVKCRFGNFNQGAPSDNTIIRQCYCTGGVYGESQVGTGFVISNCWLPRVSSFETGSDVLVANCVITHDDCVYSAALYRNNLITSNYYGGGYRSGSLGAGSTCYNNVGWQGCIENNQNNTYANNYYASTWGNDWANIFADGQGNLDYTDAAGKPRNWELKEPTVYVGTDGNPCGPTGGIYPWNPIPTLPRIIETSVDTKAEPGKLKVNIKAEARPME